MVDVYLLPAGDFPYDFTNQLARHLSDELHINVRASLPMGLADLKELPGGSQLAADEIISRAHQVGLRIEQDNPKLVVIALTTRDINDPQQGLRFLFAHNDFANRTTVISMARMVYTTPKSEANPAQISLRLYKMVKRAIGEQYFGLSRSADISDVLYAPIMSLEDIDAMGSAYKK
jgi:predicted Zn-dependent protease